MTAKKTNKPNFPVKVPNRWKSPHMGSCVASDGVETLFCAHNKLIGKDGFYQDDEMKPSTTKKLWAEGIELALKSRRVLMVDNVAGSFMRAGYVKLVEVEDVRSDEENGLTFKLVRVVEHYKI